MTPDPSRIAQHGRSVANLVSDHGKDALKMASVLASIGYPASTLGDGGSRGSDGSSSTERAALSFDRWRNVDSRLSALLDLWHLTGLQLASLLADILAHAEPEGLRPRPAGAGDCRRCDAYCSGAANDRLRVGYCQNCYMKWRRSGSLDRTTFDRSTDDEADPAA